MAAFLRKYATATHIYVPMIKRGVVDFALGADWTPATSDVKVSIDGGAAANIGTLPTAVAMGNTAFWDFTIATGEVTGKKITITVGDASTKAVEDQMILIETYGHASAEYQADLSAAAGADTSGTTTLLSRLTSTRAGYLDNLTNLDASISSLNNLSALINIYGSPLLEIPDSSSTSFAFTVVVRDSEGKLVDLDASPTITAANAAGTSRSANLSAVSHPATGRYTFMYSVASDAAEESLRITVTGAVSTEARYIEWIGAVVNYDTLTQINAIKAKTDLIPSSPATEGNVTNVGTAVSSVYTNLGLPSGAASISAMIAALGAPSQAGDEMTLTSAYDAAKTAASAAVLAAVQKIVEADSVIDTNTSPWSLVLYERGTSTELLRKSLKDVSGTGITDTDTVIGQEVE